MLGGIFFRKNCSQAAASRTLNICIIALVIVLAVFFLPQYASAQTTTQPRNSTALQVIQFPIKAGEAATAEISNLVSSTLKAGIDGYLSIGEAIWPDVPAPASVSIPSSSRTATSDRAGDRPADNQNNQNSQRAVAGTTTSDGNKASNATRLAQNLESSSGNDQQTSRPVSEQTDNVSSGTDSLLVSVLDNLTSVVSNLTRQLDNQDRVARTNTTQSAASGNSGIVTQDQLTDTRNQLREIMSKNDESILDAASDDDGPNIDSTDDVSEGSNNLYYTNKRVDTRTNELLDGGTNITLNYNQASSSLRINAATSSGQANTAANIGTGTGIFAQKSGIDLQFKSLTSGSNVTLATSSNEITIGSTQASPAGSDGAIQFNNSSAFGADGANLFWDAANNRLGVGTTSPNTKLTVAGAATVTGTTTTSRLDIGSKASIYSEDDVLNIIESGNPTRYNFGERPIFQAAGQNVFSIRGSGIIPQNNSAALGQGYAPWKKLYLTQSIRDGNSNELLEMNANDSAVNYLSIANSASGGSPTLTATGTDNSVDLKLKPKATDANGKVVVESEADSEPLFEVNNPNFSGGNGTLGVRIYDGGGSSILQEGTSLNIETLDSYPLSFSTNGSSRMQIDSSGNVGIGTTSPSSKLAVDGDINLTDGNAYQYAGNDFAYASTTQSATALGIGAEADNTKVTAIGKNAASGNSGTYVTAIGNGAAENNTEPNLVVVGGSAGKGNEGDNLVAVGIGAGFSNSGNRAVGVGKGSVRGNSGQAALGFGGGAVRGNSGDYAIGIGEGALKNNTYNSSIGLGKNASTTGANQLVIGSDTSANGEITEARIGANTQDSYPLIYANQSTGAGLGTTSPSNQLTVDGDANITDNLGVGTKNPAQNLDVVGTARIGNSNGFNDWNFKSNGEAAVRPSSGLVLEGISRSGGSGFSLYSQLEPISGNTAEGPALLSDTSGPLYVGSSGATNPTMLLYGDNKGGSTFTIRPHEAINNEDGNDLKILGGSSKPPQTVDGGNVFVSGVPGQSGGAEGDVILGHTGTSSVGNVGIGTSSPDANLMVSSDAGQTEPLFKVASSTNDPLASINSDGVLELSYKTDTSQVVIGNGASSASQDAVAIGRDANVGGNGVVIGDEAGSDSAGNLTAIGKAAGDGSSNTGYSVAIGREAMRSGTGNQVTAIGGYEPADGNSGDHVIAVGYRALLNNSGDENIGIGENTLRGTNYSGSIAIGYNASTTASNQLTIGSDTDNNGEITEARIGANTQDSFPLIYANRTGLGLGTTSPSNRLQADGTANITGTTTLATDGGNVRVGAAADVDFSDVGSSMIIGEGSTATGQNSLAVGSNASSSGDFSLAVGGDPDTNKGPVASGIGSAAIGYTDQGLIKASGDGSFAWGYDGTEDVDPFLTIKSTGDGAMAGGRAKGGSIDAAGAGSIALGYSEGSGILADGRGAVALGQDVTAEKQNSISLGKNFTNTATSTFALGYGSQQFTLDGTSGNVGIGTSTNLASVLTVSATSSASSANLQEWRDSNGTTNLAVSDAGQLTNPQYTNALVLGEVPDTSGASNSVILGPSNSDAGRNTQNSVFIGGGQSIDGEANWTTAIGSDISINNSGSNGNVVVGNNISTQGDWGITIGPEASGMGESIVLGTVASADKNNQFVVGSTDNSGEITEAKIGVNKQQPYPLIYADTTGLGLGTTDPTFRLDADGDINLTDGNAYRYAGNDFAQASTTQNGTVVGIKAANDGKHVGENETFVGYAAGDGSKVDSQNYTAIGAEALRYANNNSDNTAVGRQAGYKFTRDNATMIGVKAGGSRSGGNNLVAVGKKAANNNSVGASDNVAIGYKALENNSYSSSIGIGSYASTTAANQLVIGSDTSANGEITEARIGANTQDSYPLIYANRTGVGIGTTSPSVALSASGTISQANATNCTLEASASGDIICSTSDENLKTDKQTIDNALDRLTRLDGYTYEFRNQDRFGDGEQIGFMAQDVERVFPQLVRDTGEYKTLDYGNMTAVLAEAIKEINSKVETAASSSINAVGDFVKNGVARFKKLIADNVVAEKDVRAGERICIDGECLDKSDVRTLINIAESHNDATTSEDVSGNSPILDSRSEDQEQEDNAQDKADYNQTSTTTDSTEGDTNPSTQESGTSTSATTSPDTVSTTTQQTNTTDGDTKQATSSAQTDLANDTSDEETDEMQTNTTSSSTISSNKTEDGKDTGNTSSEPAEVDGNNSKQDNTESETGTTTTTNQ